MDFCGWFHHQGCLLEFLWNSAILIGKQHVKDVKKGFRSFSELILAWLMMAGHALWHAPQCSRCLVHQLNIMIYNDCFLQSSRSSSRLHRVMFYFQKGEHCFVGYTLVWDVRAIPNPGSYLTMEDALRNAAAFRVAGQLPASSVG